ncbi:unnamed protein product, partial [Effrenium voratum]
MLPRKIAAQREAAEKEAALGWQTLAPSCLGGQAGSGSCAMLPHGFSSSWIRRRRAFCSFENDAPFLHATCPPHCSTKHHEVKLIDFGLAINFEEGATQEAPGDGNRLDLLLLVWRCLRRGSWGGPAGRNQHMNRSWDSPLVGQWGPGERSGTGWAASPAASIFSHRCASFAIFLRLPLATAVQYAWTAAAILGLAAASAMAQEHEIYARPSGHVSTLLRAEWQAACRRLGQQLTKRAEKVTVQNALRTWAELEGFLQQRGRSFPPELLDLEVFITEATPAPARSLASLRWIFNQAKVNMDLQMIQLPRRVASRPHKRGQAAVMVSLVLRAEFNSYLEDADALSTYSFRRVAPTLGSLLKFSGTELCALGDWQDRSQLGEESRMPMHYSGARYLLSFKQKFVALGALKTLQDFTSWEGIPTVQLEPSKKAGEVFAGRAQARDEVIIWAAPPNMEELRSRLRVSIQAKVAAARRKAEPSVIQDMPDSINGIMMSAFMRNGRRLCGPFQLDACKDGEEACGRAHLCAADLMAGLQVSTAKETTNCRNIHQSGLFDQLEELEGMTLVCDCAMEVPSKADVLIGLLFERRLQSGEPGRGSGSVSRRRPRRAALAAWGGIPGAQALPRNLQKHLQESLVTRFRRLFPHEWLQHTTFPMIEDLVNSFPFSAFTEWCEDQELDVDGPMGPVLATRTARFRQITATGRQAGALSHKAALPPLQAGEPTPDEHFDHAWYRRQDREEPMLDADLRFAAACCARWRGQMIDLRRQAVGALRELKQRWQGVTAALRERQPAAIGRVTAQRDVGFTAGCVPEQEARRIPFEEVVMGAEANNQRILAGLRSGKDDVFLLSQSTLDAVVLAASRSTQRLTPGAAAKVYGLANFLELGMFGKVGAGGLHPIRMRQDERHSTLTAEICRSFELL